MRNFTLKQTKEIVEEFCGLADWLREECCDRVVLDNVTPREISDRIKMVVANLKGIINLYEQEKEGNGNERRRKHRCRMDGRKRIKT